MTIKAPSNVTSIKAAKRRRIRTKRQHLTRLALPYVVILGAAGIGGVASIRSMPVSANASKVSEEHVSGCVAVDGDTIRCGSERIRLLGIDAPEFAGHCRKGRDCAPGDPLASSQSLSEAMVGSIKIERFGTDQYGRTLATLTSDRGDLSCWQLERAQARYVARWDNGAKIAQTCPTAALN
jgi:micrococcal nuclease